MPGESGGDTVFGGLIARGGKGGGVRPDSMGNVANAGPAAAVSSEKTLTVSAMMLANHAEIQNGLLYVLGGGWEFFTLPSLPGVVQGVVTLLVDLNGFDVGDIPELSVRSLDPEGQLSFECLGQITVFESSSPGRVPLVIPFGFSCHVAGLWSMVVLHGGVELASIRYRVQEKPL
ncbi:hypothetical protein KBX06_27210 [Micromonospora sp. C31]|uniref:DUF6941 family protein n=1 Tax=Micromonospora sp. C31 TaxID=2824876 RepID=UPI001B38CA86|nr:hypothetical protein [Micromonospora sp. C31]MBQ1076809.1 hypothetical protein [Micromonospora sp. C31]